MPRSTFWSKDGKFWVCLSVLDGADRGAYAAKADREAEENYDQIVRCLVLCYYLCVVPNLIKDSVMTNSAVVLLLSDARGIYIPRDFVQSFNMKEWHVNEIDVNAYNDPENESYLDSWDSILNDTFFIDKGGNKYQLWQEGDLWAYCYDLMTDEEKQKMGFEV